MFVKYKTPLWYIDAMDKFLDKMDVCSAEFRDDANSIYCCADTIKYASKQMREAVDKRNKVKEEYTDKFEMFYSKQNCSSNYNLLEAYAVYSNLFVNLFHAKNELKALKNFIIECRMTIKKNLAEMHKIWAKWYTIVNFDVNFNGKPEKAIEKADSRKYQLNFTRDQALKILDRLSKALKSDPSRNRFTLSFHAD